MLKKILNKKEYFLFNIYWFLFGILGGLLIWIYFLINPIDPKEYKYYAYYVTADGKMEETVMAYTAEDVSIIVDYYKQREILPKEEAVFKRDGPFFYIKLNSKIKILDTIDENTAKIRVLYNHKGRENLRAVGYIPFSNIHESLLYQIEK